MVNKQFDGLVDKVWLKKEIGECDRSHGVGNVMFKMPGESLVSAIEV